MHINAHYIVTKGSDDTTFRKGDKVRIDKNKCLICINEGGWIEPDNIFKATKGWKIKLDVKWIENRKAQLEDELLWLESLSA